MNEIAAIPALQINFSSEGIVSTINDSVDATESERKHKCTHSGCGAVFSKPSKLTIHLRQHTGERPYKCDYQGCDKSYTNPSHLKRHSKTHDIVKQSLKCPKCSLIISNRQNLRRHYERVHSENSPFSCGECGLKFTEESKYKEHQAIHRGAALYKCEICSKQCTTLFTFKKHKRTHNKKKEYRCTVLNCSEVFDKWSLLVKHRNSQHISEYKCKDCDKVFLIKTQLKSHSFVHADNRSVLQCPFDKCPRFYFFKRNLDHHVRTNHMGKKYHCDICDMRLSTKQKIVDHMNKIHLAKKKKKKRKKSAQQRKRIDTGTAKKSMLSKLVGLYLPRTIEKEFLSRKTRIQLGEEDPKIQASENILETSKEIEVEDQTVVQNDCEKVTNNCVADDASSKKADEDRVVSCEFSDRTDKQTLTNCNINVLIATQ